MKSNLETINKALLNHEQHQHAVSFSKLKGEIKSFKQELQMKYLHGKIIVERKGWESEKAERNMCIDILGKKETTK